MSFRTKSSSIYGGDEIIQYCFNFHNQQMCSWVYTPPIILVSSPCLAKAAIFETSYAMHAVSMADHFLIFGRE